MTLTTVLLAPVVAAMTAAGGAAGEQVSIPIWLEMLAVVVASVSGVLTAREHKLDFIGAIGLAVACGLGGGIIRDVILQKGAVYILDQPLALPVSVATAAIAFVFPVIFEKPDRLIAILDIFAVGLYAAVGADKAMVYELSPMVCVMMGFFTAVGGGMLRDVFLGQTPGIFQRGNFYAITAIAGATSYVALVENFHAANIFALVVCVIITMVLVKTSTAVCFTWSMSRWAYSGPVSSSLKCSRPNPGWMHWRRIPPKCASRSMMATRAPTACAESAAPIPAGPPPMTKTS